MSSSAWARSGKHRSSVGIAEVLRTPLPVPGLIRDGEVCVRPLQSEHAYRDIVVIWRAGSSRAPEARLLAERLQAPGSAKSAARAS